MKITQHFKLEEFAKSETAKRLGIDNSVPKELIPNIKALCENVLEPLRTEINKTTDKIGLRREQSQTCLSYAETMANLGEANRQRTTDSASLTKDSKSPFKGDLEGLPVIISSGYRCPQLNAAVGGAKSSQHMKGEAADIHIPSVEVGRKWFEILKTLPHDQLIWERNSPTSNHYWIHVSCRADLSKNRGQCIPLLNKYSA